MQSDAPTLEQLRVHLEGVGITLDDGRLAALLPLYTGVLHGARRMAALDLGATEPATIFVQRRGAASTGGRP